MVQLSYCACPFPTTSQNIILARFRSLKFVDNKERQGHVQAMEKDDGSRHPFTHGRSCVSKDDLP